MDYGQCKDIDYLAHGLHLTGQCTQQQAQDICCEHMIPHVPDGSDCLLFNSHKDCQYVADMIVKVYGNMHKGIGMTVNPPIVVRHSGLFIIRIGFS